MHPHEIDHVDSRLTRSAALEAIAIWLEEQIEGADACQVRYSLTDAGRQALVLQAAS